MSRRLVFCAPLLLLLASTASANLVVNGSFEADAFTANGNYELGLVGNEVTGWYIPSGDGVYPWGLQDGAFGASTPFGNQWVVLGRWDTLQEYTIQQTLDGLSVGGQYRLTFSIASELGCCSTAEVSFLGGSSTASQQFVAPNSAVPYWADWATYSYDFVADASSVTFQFRNVNPTSAGGYDLGLDNVQVDEVSAPIPEPGTMSLIGLGLAGLVGKMRRRSS